MDKLNKGKELLENATTKMTETGTKAFDKMTGPEAEKAVSRLTQSAQSIGQKVFTSGAKLGGALSPYINTTSDQGKLRLGYAVIALFIGYKFIQHRGGKQSESVQVKKEEEKLAWASQIILEHERKLAKDQ